MQSRFRNTAVRVLSVALAAVGMGIGVPGLRTISGSQAAPMQQDAGSGPGGFLAQATKAVNSRHLEEIKPLVGEGAVGAFAWIPEAHEIWESAELTVPPFPTDGRREKAYSSALTRLAVFHAWHSCQSDGDHVHRLYHNSQGWQIGPEILETETLGFRVRDHDLHVLFDVPRKNAALTDTIQVERTADRAPDFGLLRISHDFHIESIALAGSAGKTAVRFRQAGGIIAFVPPAERKFALTLHYSGHLDNRESDYIRANEAVLCSYWYPHIARLPARTTVTFTTPPEWKGIAQGELMRETHSPDGSTTATYRNEVPNCFYTLDVGRYSLITRRVKNRTLSVYQLKSNPGLAHACLDTLSASLDYYERTFAPFPFSHYTIVETQGDFSGALEAYSFATFGSKTLPELIPHELSHTWWGGMIPCTYTHSMWDEAFAEYSDDLFTRSQEGAGPDDSPSYPMPDKLLEERRKRALSYAPLALARAFDTEDAHHIAVGYEKGRQVLKTLEAQIGQPLMLRCLRRFFAEHPKGEAADWPEFASAVKKETGADYAWFFVEWLERKGEPILALAHTAFRKDGDGYLVETDVVQEGEPYRLQLPILVETAAGKAFRAVKEIDGTMTHLTFHIGSAPTRLRLDPLGEVPFAPPLGSPSAADPTIFVFTP